VQRSGSAQGRRLARAKSLQTQA